MVTTDEEHTTQRAKMSFDSAWKLNLSRGEALKWVNRKLPRAREVRASLYYHPMLGCEFDWTGPRGKLIKINILVDLNSGRGFAAAPWTTANFTTRAVDVMRDNAHSIRTPEPQVALDQARQTARSVAQVLVTRKRRFGGVGTLQLNDREVSFVKPNWWVTGENGGRDLELILDGITGRHYVFSG